ncbi:hypothetical protein AWB74_07839 [Caballeronia arvi]|uniref:Uncharacterized protein n=1 Tax=Caballeronia arvi TaxID=1777135 RepID=A0A158L1A5_9BURK|nr:hypothetical protein AWB74_07839 [Caballeronia arvi]
MIPGHSHGGQFDVQAHLHGQIVVLPRGRSPCFLTPRWPGSVASALCRHNLVSTIFFCPLSFHSALLADPFEFHFDQSS